jgi:hypothetical protein
MRDGLSNPLAHARSHPSSLALTEQRPPARMRSRPLHRFPLARSAHFCGQSNHRGTREIRGGGGRANPASLFRVVCVFRYNCSAGGADGIACKQAPTKCRTLRPPRPPVKRIGFGNDPKGLCRGRRYLFRAVGAGQFSPALCLCVFVVKSPDSAARPLRSQSFEPQRHRDTKDNPRCCFGKHA